MGTLVFRVIILCTNFLYPSIENRLRIKWSAVITTKKDSQHHMTIIIFSYRVFITKIHCISCVFGELLSGLSTTLHHVIRGKYPVFLQSPSKFPKDCKMSQGNQRESAAKKFFIMRNWAYKLKAINMRIVSVRNAGPVIILQSLDSQFLHCS